MSGSRAGRFASDSQSFHPPNCNIPGKRRIPIVQAYHAILGSWEVAIWQKVFNRDVCFSPRQGLVFPLDSPSAALAAEYPPRYAGLRQL